MDDAGKSWHYRDMTTPPIPAWQLYGESSPFPDVLHMERIRDRAAGLDWRIAPHRHAHLAQIFLLTRGHAVIGLDGHVNQPPLPLMLFIPPNLIHGFTFAAGTEGWVLTLPVESHPQLFAQGAEIAPMTTAPVLGTPAAAALDLVTSLHAAWQGNAPLRRTNLQGMLTQLICTLLQDHAVNSASVPPAQTRLLRFSELIANHHAQHWSLDRYAAEMGMSPRNLGRLCRAQAGMSAHGMIESHLMREATRLLAYTRMTAQAIAYQLGYQDPSYFNRRFRKVMGLSPGAYRQRLEG